MTEKRKKILSILFIVVFVLFVVVIAVYVGRPMVEFAQNPEAFRDWVDDYGIWGRVMFVGMVVLQVVIAIIPGGPLELAAGYAFGLWEGSLLCMIGFIIGSWIVFVLVRKFGVKLVEVFFDRKKIDEIKFLQNPKKTKILSFILMVIPGTPKDLLNYSAGLTKLSAGEWLTIVAVGRIPALVATVLSGDAAGEENYLLAVITIAVTLALSAAGIIYYRYICKHENE